MNGSEMNEDCLVYEQRNGVVTLTLNRPRQFNALSEELLGALQSALDRIAVDSSVRCVVLAAAGKAFCAGHDLRQMRGRPEFSYYQQLFTQCSRVMRGILALPVPVIARVQGLATAAGCQLVATCDLAIASTESRFAVSGIDAGLFCSTPSVALSRNIATKRAFDMLVTARFIDAATALDWGLVNEVVEPTQLDDAVARKVGVILGKSAAAIRHGKAMFYRQLGMPVDEAYAFASDVMAHNMMEDDAGEGIDAFLQKRPPRWHSPGLADEPE